MNFNLSLDDMEGEVGGSTLDDLRCLMGIDSLHDGDIVFAQVGETYFAKCLVKESPLFKSAIGSDGYLEWNKE